MEKKITDSEIARFYDLTVQCVGNYKRGQYSRSGKIINQPKKKLVYNALKFYLEKSGEKVGS